jgi:transcriptional regulator with XRE-family HTH domain
MITDFLTSSLSSDFFISDDNTTVHHKVNTNVLGKGNTFVLPCSTMKYGERLKAAREHAGLSQEELVRLSGVKQGTISKIERGDQNFSGFDAKLAHCLNINALWLSEGNVNFAPDWLIGSEKITTKKTFYTKFETLSNEQRKELENFLDFIINKTINEKKVLTKQTENVLVGVNDAYSIAHQQWLEDEKKRQNKIEEKRQQTIREMTDITQKNMVAFGKSKLKLEPRKSAPTLNEIEEVLATNDASKFLDLLSPPIGEGC